MKFRYRWVTLIVYAVSPVLVHGTELGRPDHQSLVMLLVTVAICAEWTSRSESSTQWSALSGTAWGLALWVSFYEPLVLFAIVVGVNLLRDRRSLFAKYWRFGWICFAAVLAIAFLIEQRIPAMSIFQSTEIFKNWTRTIGELVHVSPANPIWLRWTGYLLLVAPFLVWVSLRKGTLLPSTILALLVATYGLTIWQGRWAYFFVSVFAIALPDLLEPIKSRTAVWVAFVMSIFDCVIGTRNFGLTKRNTPVGSNSGMNRCGCAIWQSICNRRRAARFWHHGGFRHRSRIGQSSRAWLAAHTKACRELQTARGSSFPKIGQAREKFWRIARWPG
jgi:hypothetical protein